MRKITFFVTLLLLLAGCRQDRAVSPRLVELDSLIAVDPDSAAALLQDYPADSLRDPENRAYHALLTTQAKYKADIHAYSLDTINLAVAHYADGHDPEKQTRSTLYKGCVFEELPQPDSAMYYYKYAEDLATQSGDTYHRGYALMRMATLFQSKYAKKEAIDCFLQSLSCAKEIDNDYDALYALQELGNLYQSVNLDSAFYFIDQAMTLSLQMDSAGYSYNLATLSACYLLKPDYSHCVTTARQAISTAADRTIAFRACHWAAQAYAKLGMSDSGMYFFCLAPPPINKADSVLFLSTKGVLSSDPFYQTLSGDMADTLVNIDTVVSLTNAGKRYDQQKSKAIAKKKSQMTQLLLAIALFFILLLFIVFWVKKRKERKLINTIEHGNKRITSLEGELKASNDLADTQQAEITQLNDDLNEQRLQKQSLELAIYNKEAEIIEHESQILELSEALTNRDKTISGLVTDQALLQDKRDELLCQSAKLTQELQSLRDELASIKQDQTENDKNVELLREQINTQRLRVMAIVSEMVQGATIFYQTLKMQGMANDMVTTKFRQYVNASFMIRLEGLLDIAYPSLAQRIGDANCDKDDKDIVYLHFAGFSNEIICGYLNLTNKKTISNKKRSIATKLLGTNASINQLAQ